MAKNEIEYYKWNAQLDIESASYPDIEECYAYGKYGEILWDFNFV